MGKTLRCFSDSKLECRDEGGSAVIAGYAAVYNSPSVDFGGWQEVVMPGAFDRSLKSGRDVVARVEHESGTNIIGRVSNGTLKLRSDKRGLHYEVSPPDTQMGRDIITLVKRGDISKSSFAFVPQPQPDGYSWDDTGDVPIRRLLDVDLYDVAPVGEPAYPGSDLWSEERKITAIATLSDLEATMPPDRVRQKIRAHGLLEGWRGAGDRQVVYVDTPEKEEAASEYIKKMETRRTAAHDLALSAAIRELMEKHRPYKMS